jgi:amino acid transporter
MFDLIWIAGFLFTFVLMVVGFSAHWAWQERKNKRYIDDADDVTFKLVLPFLGLSLACTFWFFVLPVALLIIVGVATVKFLKAKFVWIFEKINSVKEKFANE